MSKNQEHYRGLGRRLLKIRAANKGKDSKEEDRILEEMDEVWKNLSETERTVLQIKKFAAHPKKPVEGVEVIMEDDTVGKEKMEKERFHVGIRGSDLEFVFDLIPGWDSDKASFFKDIAARIQVQLEETGMGSAMKKISGSEPDMWIDPKGTIDLNLAISMAAEKEIRIKYQGIVFDILYTLDMFRKGITVNEVVEVVRDLNAKYRALWKASSALVAGWEKSLHEVVRCHLNDEFHAGLLKLKKILDGKEGPE